MLKSIFQDSKIVQQISLKRTKATAIAKAVIWDTEKENLAFKLKQSKFQSNPDLANEGATGTKII